MQLSIVLALTATLAYADDEVLDMGGLDLEKLLADAEAGVLGGFEPNWDGVAGSNYNAWSCNALSMGYMVAGQICEQGDLCKPFREFWDPTGDFMQDKLLGYDETCDGAYPEDGAKFPEWAMGEVTDQVSSWLCDGYDALDLDYDTYGVRDSVCRRNEMPDMQALMNVAGDAYKKHVPDDTSSAAYKLLVLNEVEGIDMDGSTDQMGCDVYTMFDEDDTSSGLYNALCGGSLDPATVACEAYKKFNPEDTTSA